MDGLLNSQHETYKSSTFNVQPKAPVVDQSVEFKNQNKEVMEMYQQNKEYINKVVEYFNKVIAKELSKFE